MRSTCMISLPRFRDPCREYSHTNIGQPLTYLRSRARARAHGPCIKHTQTRDDLSRVSRTPPPLARSNNDPRSPVNFRARARCSFVSRCRLKARRVAPRARFLLLAASPRCAMYLKRLDKNPCTWFFFFTLECENAKEYGFAYPLDRSFFVRSLWSRCSHICRKDQDSRVKQLILQKN